MNAYHRTAEAIVRLRTDLSEAEQDALYGRIFIGPFEDNVGSMGITELLAALARPRVRSWTSRQRSLIGAILRDSRPKQRTDINMTTPLLNVRLIDDDGQRFIAWNTENPAAALNAQNVELLIAGLANLREQISPPVSAAEPAANEPAEAKLDPQWCIGPETFVGGAMLKVRHPGLGWLAFAIPLDNLRKLHEGLGNLVKWAEERAAGESAN